MDGQASELTLQTLVRRRLGSPGMKVKFVQLETARGEAQRRPVPLATRGQHLEEKKKLVIDRPIVELFQGRSLKRIR